MGKDWMVSLLKDREEKQRKAQADSQLLMIALTRSSHMWRKLCDQVKSDVEKYSRATNTPIAIDLSHPEVLDINYEQYPHFRLRIGSRPPAITVWQDTKKNTDSTKKPPKESEILVVAKSQDELLYRVNGEDKIDEADVSEFLLKPLLEFIES